MSEIDLRRLDFFPSSNPLLSNSSVPVKHKMVKSEFADRRLIDAETGEHLATSVIRQIELVDDEQFVKIFSIGVAEAYKLTKTGQRVFQAVLREYEKTPMTRGFAATVALAWFDGGLSGEALDMSEKTFRRGLKELLAKSFIAPRIPNDYWVNPALFFKGDRVMFIKEYKRKKLIIENKELLQNERLPNATTLAAFEESERGEGERMTFDEMKEWMRAEGKNAGI